MAKKVASEKVNVSVLMPRSLVNTLGEMAKDQGETLTSVVRRLIRAGLRAEQAD